MNDLRLYMLVIGICIIAGVYFWGTYQSRKQHRHETVQQRSSDTTLEGIKISSTPDVNIDYSSALAGLNQSLSQSRGEQVDTDEGRKVSNDNTLSKQRMIIDDEATVATGEVLAEQKTDQSVNDEPSPRNTGFSNQQIITLYVIPRANGVIDGLAILNAFEQVDMELGAMGIFHHYGVGEMKMEHALFSVANMIEPGTFNITNMDSFSTRGLAMFMSLPARIDGQVVFELMLNTAHRLAEIFKADVCDESRSLINEQKIESIRNSILI
jgi:cell division protein ZipA